MKYQVEFKPRALKDCKNIDKSILKTIFSKIEARELYRKNWNGWSVAVWPESVLNSIQTLKRQWQKNEQDISTKIGSSC